MIPASAHPRRAAAVLALAAVALFVAACSGSAAPVDQAGGGAPALSNVGSAVDGTQVQPAQPAPAAGGKTGSGTSSADGSTTTTSAEAASAEQALIVKTGTLDLQVSDVDAAVVRARTLISGFGGYVSGSQQTTKGDQPVA
jgi:hypothetical protein